MVKNVNHTDSKSKRYTDINDNFAELSGGAGGGSLPEGSANELLTWDEEGNSIASPFTADMWGGFYPELIPDNTMLVPAIQMGVGGVVLGQSFAFASPLVDVKGVVLREGAGTIQTAQATQSYHAVPLSQLNTRLATAPTASVRGGVLQGVAVANATDATSVITQLNALLTQLRAVGVIAS